MLALPTHTTITKRALPNEVNTVPKVLEAIQNFIRTRRPTHNAPELLDRWTPDMETQVNVAADNGEPVDGKRNTYTDGEYEWFNIRIPKNAATDPEFKDYQLRWPLELHVEGIGWTGWDWKARKSRAFGFDFDAITAHAKGVGVSDEELERVKQAAMSLPYVEVRKSTGGMGLHPYVYLDDAGIPTANHTEHAALARCILGMMSAETGFDFASCIDACGGNMWIHHRKATKENGGLSLIKAAETVLSLADLPANWRDHIEVVTRRRAKVRVSGILDDALDPFEALTSSGLIVPLDDQHKATIEELRQSGFSTIWVPDHHLLQTHSVALAKLMESGKYRGVFRTNSEGKHPQTPNVFMFPRYDGAWKVYRFSPGVQEAETWNQDREGWTWCYFNKKPNLKTACRASGGIEQEQGGFIFKAFDDAKKAAELVGGTIAAEGCEQRKTILKTHKDGRLIVHVDRSEGDTPPRGYAEKGKQWVRIYDTVTEENKEETADPDDYIRKATTANGDDAGYYINRDGWGSVSFTDAKISLMDDGLTKIDAERKLGGKVKRAWKLVNIPFGPLYPGGRQWNLGAAQYSCQPAILADDEVPYHPSWDKIFNHTFDSLTPYLKNLKWAKEAKIFIGGDYGRHWFARLLRDPFEPLPYLFLYGEENSGKSIIHEAAGKLMTKGVVKADRALTTKGDFNGELANAILCVIEEQDVSKHPGALARIREWVTNKSLSIRRMHTDTYEQPSTLHFIQCSNWFGAYPCFPGETRAMVLHVPRFKGDEIPKKELLEKLETEAPHFLRTLLDLELPPATDRLGLPIVDTIDKQELANENAPINRFLAERCKLEEGARTIKMRLHNAYNAWALENGFEGLHINEFGKQLRAVSKNKIHATGQKTDTDGKIKHTYEGVSLTMAV